MNRALLFLLVLSALGALHIHDARACGGFASRRRPTDAELVKSLPYLTVEQTLILWDKDTQTEDFIRETRFDGAADAFGFVVPTPGKPEVSAVKDPPFERLRKRFPFYQPDLGLVGGGGGGRAPGAAAPPAVEVLSQQRIGSFTAFTLATTDAGAFDRWLADNDFVMSAEAKPWLEHYVKLKFFFCAFRYEGKDAGAGSMTSETVRIRFKTPHAYYPYLEPAHAAGAPEPTQRMLTGWILSREELAVVASRPSSPVRWGTPWGFGAKSDMRPSEYAAALGPELAALMPAGAKSLVMQPFRDMKRSREGWGDAVLVPRDPVSFTPDEAAARELFLPVLDPALIGEGVAAPVAAADASAPPISSALPPPEPKKSGTSCAMSRRRGGSGSAVLFLVLAGAFVLRRRRALLAAVCLLGCRRSDAPADASAIEAAAPVVTRPRPITLADRRAAALGILAGEMPYEERDSAYPRAQLWMGAPTPKRTGPNDHAYDFVIREKRRNMYACYIDALKVDPAAEGDVALTAVAASDGSFKATATSATLPATLTTCIAKTAETARVYFDSVDTAPTRFRLTLTQSR